jgi:hypothetical protein
MKEEMLLFSHGYANTRINAVSIDEEGGVRHGASVPFVKQEQ